MADANLMACLITKNHAKKMLFCQDSETVAQMCSVKKVFLEISQKSRVFFFCPSLFFNKVAGVRPASFLKRNSGTGVFLWIL